MRTYFLMIFGFIALTINAQKAINVKHKIDSITVYLNSAEIIRSGTVKLPKGKTNLVFNNLSSKMMEAGLKVSVGENVSIYSVTSGHATNIENDTPEIKKLKKSIDQIQKQIWEKENLNSIYLKEIKYFEENLKSQNLNIIKIEQGAAFYRKKLALLNNKIHQTELEIDKLIEQKNKLMEQKDELETNLKKTASFIKIQVICTEPTSTKVQVRYLVSHALWKPIYAIRSTENSPKITIQYQAQIYNDCGEDWQNKPLTLAIFDSSDDVNKPQLQTWSLDMGNHFNNIDNSTALSNSLINQNYKNVDFDELLVDDLSTRFKITDLHNIPSDATPHLIDVKTYHKNASFYTLSIPKEKNGAYKIASVSDWKSLGLLDGKANLYYNNAYQGQTVLKTQQTNDTLEFALGRNNNFLVTRKKVNSSSRKSLFGFTIKDVETYEITVKNNKNLPLDITIQDQIPVSEDKDVKVEIINIDGAKLKPVTGLLTWNLHMKPNETRKIMLKYSIKYPKSKKRIYFKSNMIRSPRFF